MTRPYEANSNVGMPMTFVSILNSPPESGYFFRSASLMPFRADVMYNSFMSLPPKMQEDVCKAGTGICSNS